MDPKRSTRWARPLGTLLVIGTALVGGYFSSREEPKLAGERLPLEIKQKLGLEQVWIEQRGKGRYIGRGVDTQGGDYDLDFRGSYATWSYTATDKQTGLKRTGEIRWSGPAAE